MPTADLLPHGLLFDLDGTLLDSEWYWREAESALFTKHGLVYTDEFAEAAIGIPIPLWVSRVRDEFDLDADPIAMEQDLVDLMVEVTASRPTLWRPGAYELLERAVFLGIPTALVTASPKVIADVVTTKAPAGTLEICVAGDMVPAGKPAPDPYLMAASGIGVNPNDCVAFEDSPFGIRAAMAARTHAVAVPFMVEIPPFEGIHRITSLEEVDDAFLRHLMTMPLPQGDPLRGAVH
ncbi:HAD family phosphatase [Actinomycetaceae bacterium L2_0104]